MPIITDKGDMTEIYCPYCNTFYGYVTSRSFWYDDGEREANCNKCGKPFLIKKAE